MERVARQSTEEHVQERQRWLKEMEAQKQELSEKLLQKQKESKRLAEEIPNLKGRIQLLEANISKTRALLDTESPTEEHPKSPKNFIELSDDDENVTHQRNVDNHERIQTRTARQARPKRPHIPSNTPAKKKRVRRTQFQIMEDEGHLDVPCGGRRRSRVKK